MTRIVSLLPSATEIVCALGLEDDLVGITHECDYPSAVRGKPIVTSSVLSNGTGSADIDRHIRRLVHDGSSICTLDADRLAALKPDLILTQELCEVCAVSYPIVERAVRRLEAETQLVSLEPESLEDVFETVRTVGRLTARTARADQVVAELQARIAAVEARISNAPRHPVVCLEWVDPPYNCGHWTPELVRIAGGEALLGTAGRPARPVADDELAGLRPSLAVVMACGVALARSVDEVRRSNLLEAVAGEFWVVDGNAYFSRPGPRLVDSVEILAGILHPDRADPPSPESAVRLR